MDLWVDMKFMKADVVGSGDTSRPAVRLDTADKRVFAMDCPVHGVDNPRETIIPLCVPRGANLVLDFDLLAPVRRVLVSAHDVPFSVRGDRLTVYLPAQQADVRDTAQLHGYIAQPGIQIRVELPDPLRAAGDYAGRPFPDRETRMTLAMQFALLQAALAVGVDHSAGLGPLGPVTIMGFDTNNPGGHTDFPPHVHIHPFGTRYNAPITHYYYGADGRLDFNMVDRRLVEGHRKKLGRGERFEHLSLDGQVMYATEITEQGGLRMIGQQGSVATVTPVGGESTEVILSAQGRSSTYRAHMDVENGVLTVDVDGKIQQHRFDMDTGVYMGVAPGSAMAH